jgi:hypothetical protein
MGNPSHNFGHKIVQPQVQMRTSPPQSTWNLSNDFMTEIATSHLNCSEYRRALGIVVACDAIDCHANDLCQEGRQLIIDALVAAIV